MVHKAYGNGGLRTYRLDSTPSLKARGGAENGAYLRSGRHVPPTGPDGCGGSDAALKASWLPWNHDPLTRVTQSGEPASQGGEARYGGESRVNRIERGTTQPIEAQSVGYSSGPQGRKPPRPLGLNSPCRARRRKTTAKEHVACMGEDLDGTVPHDGCFCLAWIAQLGCRLKGSGADSYPLVEASREPLVVGRRQKDVHAKGPELAFARSRTAPGPASRPRRRINRHDGGSPPSE